MNSAIRLRISVMGLLVDADRVLMIHKITGPEPNCWDLPGGGLNPGEPILQALQREIREETGLMQIRVESLLTIIEGFFPNWQGQLLHSLNIIYQCKPGENATILSDPEGGSHGDQEVGSKGVQWLSIADLTPDQCSRRSWQALQAAGLV